MCGVADGIGVCHEAIRVCTAFGGSGFRRRYWDRTGNRDRRRIGATVEHRQPCIGENLDGRFLAE